MKVDYIEAHYIKHFSLSIRHTHSLIKTSWIIPSEQIFHTILKTYEYIYKYLIGIANCHLNWLRILSASQQGKPIAYFDTEITDSRQQNHTAHRSGCWKLIPSLNSDQSSLSLCSMVVLVVGWVLELADLRLCYAVSTWLTNCMVVVQTH